LLRLRVLAGGFAELLGGLRDVEDVVDHLEREADVIAKIRQRLQLRGAAIRAHAAEADRTAEQRGSFALVNVAELRGGSFFSFAFQVGDLSGDELQRT